MFYFSRFPTTKFLITAAKAGQAEQYVSLTDITKNVRFKRNIIDNITLYDFYLLSDRETLENVSESIYGSPYYHWVLMLLNNIYDYRTDLPLDAFSFNEYIVDKYGDLATAQSTISFYKDSRGFVVEQDNENFEGEIDATPVYAYDHELEINEAKRKIKVISPNLLSVVLENFRELME